MSKENLIGQQFGRLTVVGEAENIGRYTAWECKCSCGNHVIVRANALKSVTTKSCGCLNQEKRKSRYNDLTGQQFGRLAVIKRSKNKGKHVMWECKCSCGNTVVVRANSLKSGVTKSCGCLAREDRSKRTTERNYKHGKSGTRLCHIWYGLKDRCYRSTSSRYKYYGAKGVRVCSEWQYNFENFYKWAMENGYDDTLTIDRINPYGNYEPSNCRWVTWEVQHQNTRKSYLDKSQED